MHSYDTTLPISERKRHGVFYTPAPVTRYLLRATAPAGPVADLSCGDGAFLTEAARLGHPVIGIDRDAGALAKAAEHLAPYPAAQYRLLCGDGLAPDLPWTPDVILGNPPYLEAKKADPALKLRCRRLFPTIARGAFDIYICFIKAGLDALPPGGRLGYIVPNKFLVADYARPLREELLANTTIEEIVDVSDLPTFRDAAVYPVLLVLRKTPPPAGHTVRVGQVSDLAQLESGTFPQTAVAQAQWRQTTQRVFWLPPANACARRLVDRLLADPHGERLASLLDIRWTVSFHRTGLRDRFIFPAPTGRCPRRLLGGKAFHGNADICRYRTAWSGWWIDYDRERAQAERNPLPSAAIFDAPKLVIAQNARRIVATLDREEFVCKDTFLVGLPMSAGHLFDAGLPLEYLLGLLNSKLISYLYGTLFKGTHVGGAYLHYLTGYLGDLPVHRANDPAPIVTFVRQLLNPMLPDTERRALDARLDQLIYDLYDVMPEERELVEQTIDHTWGEPGMRRGQWQADGDAETPITNNNMKNVE